MTELIIADSAC